MWEGHIDKLADFVKGGYWYLGYTSNEDARQNAKRDEMRVGDRLAIKRMLGQGATDIEIRALGCIKHIDDEDGYKRVYVDWVTHDIKRRVPSKGCYQSVHGPFDPEDPWTQQVFCL